MFKKLAAVVAAGLVLVSVLFFTGRATASGEMKGYIDKVTQSERLNG